jgi:hypothetical protein
VKDCELVENRSTFSFGGALMALSWSSGESDRTFSNVMLVNNPSTGIYVQHTTSGESRWRIVNSTISGNTNGGGDNGHGIDAFTFSTGQLAIHTYNGIVWGNSPDAYDIDIRGNITLDADNSDIGTVRTGGRAEYRAGDAVFDVDPLFVSPAESNYHLQGASPLRDAGTARGTPLTDFEGDRRDLTESPDIGADEITAAPSGDFVLRWYSIDGGAKESQDEEFHLAGTIGQPDAGNMSAGDIKLTGGFWAFPGNAPRCRRVPNWECDGDVDGDGQVNPVDSGIVQANLGNDDEQALCNYDIDCDGQINPVDAGMVQSLFGTCDPPRAVCP